MSYLDDIMLYVDDPCDPVDPAAFVGTLQVVEQTVLDPDEPAFLFGEATPPGVV